MFRHSQLTAKNPQFAVFLAWPLELTATDMTSRPAMKYVSVGIHHRRLT